MYAYIIKQSIINSTDDSQFRVYVHLFYITTYPQFHR